MKKELQKKVLITGGTGSVGQALIESFSLHKYDVYFQFNQSVKIATMLQKKFGAKKVQIDFFNKFKLPNINFDILINNAGINISDKLTHKVSDEDWKKTLLINLEVPFKIIKNYLPYMIKNKWGRIINISSIYGLRASEQNLPYTVSKHALTGITQTIAKEYASFGINCNEICPSAIESEMMTRFAKKSVNKKESSSIEEYLKEVSESIPAKRMAKPIDIASLALYLASDEAGFINGCSIPVDGGLIC
jgi:NAD(P)-dependent dehydrogenase (short-subunit alcohol dehydrogenase family)